MTQTSPLWLVTGADGFLGNNLVRLLCERGERVRAIVAEPSTPESLARLPCSIVQADVTDFASIERAFAHEAGEQTVAVHCAGIVSIAGRASERVRAVNVGGTENVLAASRSQHIDRLVHISSVHAITEPPAGTLAVEVDRAEAFDPNTVTGEYAKTKAEATRAVFTATDLSRVVLFPSGIIGPSDFGDSHLTRLIRDVLNGQLTAVVSGGYDFVDVRDVAEAIVAAASLEVSGQGFIVSGGFCTVADLAQLAAEAAKRRRGFNVLPLWFARASAPLAEVYYRLRGTKPLFTKYSLFTVASHTRFSHERSSRELGFAPRPVAETVRDTVAWLRAHDAQHHARASSTGPA